MLNESLESLLGNWMKLDIGVLSRERCAPLLTVRLKYPNLNN